VNSTAAVIAVIVGFIGFFLARWVRANADVKGTAEALQGRIRERREAAMWTLALVGGVVLFVYAKGAT
jgi:hypothetical protein